MATLYSSYAKICSAWRRLFTTRVKQRGLKNKKQAKITPESEGQENPVQTACPAKPSQTQPGLHSKVQCQGTFLFPLLLVKTVRLSLKEKDGSGRLTQPLVPLMT